MRTYDSNDQIGWQHTNVIVEGALKLMKVTKCLRIALLKFGQCIPGGIEEDRSWHACARLLDERECYAKVLPSEVVDLVTCHCMRHSVSASSEVLEVQEKP